MAVENARVTVREALARGARLHRAGRLRQAEAVYRRVLEARPDDPDALHLLGVLSRQSGEPETAVELITRAIARHGANPTYHANLGTALEAAGRRDEALAAYRRAIEIAPDYPEAHFKLGLALEAAGENEDAAAALTRAAEIRPDMAEAHLALGRVLQALRRFDPAFAAYRRAAEARPDLAEAHYRLGQLFRLAGRKDRALAAYRRAVRAKPDHDGALFGLSALLMEAGAVDDLLAVCDEVLRRDPGGRRMLSTKIAVLQAAGRPDEARRLLDFDRFVKQRDFAAPADFASLAAFNAALCDEVRAHPTLEFERAGHATRFGGHTGDLLIEPGPAVAALEAMMQQAVREYLDETGEDPDHPFLAGRPRRWRLQAWAVVMDTKGHQLPHIHTAAWLSGVYYASLPPGLGAGGNAREGWIEFGRPQPELLGQAEPDLRYYEPREGRMFLFPSYFYHATVPIETREQRISIAFDLIARE